jgi:hypothetical protein
MIGYCYNLSRTAILWLMLKFSRRVVGSVVAVALVSGGLSLAGVGAAQAETVEYPIAFNIEGATTSGFVVGDQISFTYTATNATSSTIVFPEGAIIAAEYTGKYEDPGPTPSESCQSNGFGDPGPYIVLEYAFDLPASLAPGASLSCTLTYDATAADVANGGVWTRVYYQPDGYLGGWAPGWFLEVMASSPNDKLLTVIGSPVVGSTLSAALGYWGQWDVHTYQWLRGGVAVAGSTTANYKLSAADAGKAMSVVVDGVNEEDGSSFNVTSAPTAPVTSPALTGPTPTISGAAAVGNTLTAKTGTWTTGSTLAYQWFASGTKISGATAKTLAVTPAQVGKTITVKVIGTLSGTTVSKSSAATAAVVAGTLVSPTPAIAGTVAVGTILTAKSGTWTTGTTLKYQWYASGAAISGATAKTFAATSAQLGKTVTVKVTGALAGYTSVSKSSAATVKVAAGTLVAPTPAISGTATVGSTLTAKTGTWTTGATLKYQWYASGAAISGATAKTFVPASAQVGKIVTVKVTGSLSGYTSVAKTSAATAKVVK